MHDLDETADTCAGCHRLNPTPARVCERCRQTAAEQLADLVRLHPILLLAQYPGGGPAGPGGGTRAEAPLPVRIDAFSLMAAGTIDDVADPGDRHGVPPLAVWANAWARGWSARYDEGTPRVVVVGGWPAQPGSAALMRHLLVGGGKLVIGHDGEGRPVRRAIADTLDAEYAARYGRPDGDAFARAIGYLASRLDAACDEHPNIDGFLVGLRAVYGAARAAAGDPSSLIHLGRCPEVRRDHETGEERACGGSLWQDPFAKIVTCPRCRTETHERQWLSLGKRIRAAWPEVSAVHQLDATHVVIQPRWERGVQVEPGSRHWSVSCRCGLWAEIVHGNKLDARGAWRRHVDAAGASTESERLAG